MRPIYPAAAFLALLFLCPDSARACTCMPDNKTYAERRLEVPAVFHGKVASNQVDSAKYLRRIHFMVIQDYSFNEGFVKDTVTIWTTLNDAACGIDIPVGEEALILAGTSSFPAGKPAGALSASSCSHSAWGANLQQALGELQSAGVRSASPRAAARADGAVIDCGQFLFKGKVRANGALWNAPGNR